MIAGTADKVAMYWYLEPSVSAHMSWCGDYTHTHAAAHTQATHRHATTHTRARTHAVANTHAAAHMHTHMQQQHTCAPAPTHAIAHTHAHTYHMRGKIVFSGVI